MDVATKGQAPLIEEFENTIAFEWLKNNEIIIIFTCHMREIIYTGLYMSHGTGFSNNIFQDKY